MNFHGTGEIASDASRGGTAGLLRAVALSAALVGAAGSFGMMLRVGRRNPSLLLLLLFTVWVLSPFVSLIWANAVPKSWPALKQAMLHGMTLVIALASLAVYGLVAFGPHRAQPAAAFLLVPLASWLVIAVVVLASRGHSRRSSSETQS